jgi:hypothetical protein
MPLPLLQTSQRNNKMFMYYLIYLKQGIISLTGIFLFNQAGKNVPVCLRQLSACYR